MDVIEIIMPFCYIQFIIIDIVKDKSLSLSIQRQSVEILMSLTII